MKGVHRDPTIDTLRGVAIVTMVAANLAGPVLIEPHPLWLRLYGTFAAAIFVLLSGMMVGRSLDLRARTLPYFVGRGAAILVVGALIDVLVWHIYPFTAVDVLYLIGASLPLAAALHAWSGALEWAVIGLVFVSTPVLQSILRYAPYPTEIALRGTSTMVVADPMTIANHWLVDGYFPLFPWLGFALLGAALAGVRWRDRTIVTFAGWPSLAASLALLVSGVAIWTRWPGPLLTRGGYSEMFYPPTLGYVLTATGVIGLLFWIVDRDPARSAYSALRALGESSLFMYVLHLVAIRYVVKPIWPRVGLPSFAAIYVPLVAVLILGGYGLQVLKKRR